MTEQTGETERRAADRVDVAGARILIVDDSRAIRQILRRALQDIGYRVTEAADGIDALTACRHERPDLVLLDVDMPVMDGLAALTEMRADPKLTTLPVIFLTARTAGDDVAVGLGLGAQDYLRKPCHPAELAARVSAVLRLKAAEDALRQRAQALDELSTTDALTGLGNRRRLELECRHLATTPGSPAAAGFILIDIDYFKKVNDTEGHPIGDLVLRAIAGRLLEVAVQPVTIVRWGGEEFFALAPGFSADEVTRLAERLRSVVCDSPIAIGTGRTLPITVSIGCCLGPLDNLEDGIRVADDALYSAKRSGRNRVTTSAMSDGTAPPAI